jgi:hypothetical protein
MIVKTKIKFPNCKTVEHVEKYCQHSYSKEKIDEFIRKLNPETYIIFERKEETVPCPSCLQQTIKYSVEYGYIENTYEIEVDSLEQLEELFEDNLAYTLYKEYDGTYFLDE